MTNEAKAAAMTTAPTPTREPFKLEHALALLIEHDRQRLYVNAETARRAYGDYAWHSTVDKLRKKGLAFIQRPAQLPHRHGGFVRLEDYRLSPGSREVAEKLLAHYRRARGVLPADPEESRRHDA